MFLLLAFYNFLKPNERLTMNVDSDIRDGFICLY